MLGKLDSVGGKKFQGYLQLGPPWPDVLMPLKPFSPSRVQFPQRCRPGLWGTPPCGAAHGPGCPNIYPLPAKPACPSPGSPGPWLAWPTSTVTYLLCRNWEKWGKSQNLSLNSLSAVIVSIFSNINNRPYSTIGCLLQTVYLFLLFTARAVQYYLLFTVDRILFSVVYCRGSAAMLISAVSMCIRNITNLIKNRRVRIKDEIRRVQFLTEEFK